MKPVRIIVAAAAVVLVVVVVVAVVFLFSSPGNATKTTRQSPTVAAPTVQPWYSGGTLRRATVRQWLAATERNKLATCADFVTRTYRSKGLADEDIDIHGKVKLMAVELMACIDEATAGGLVDHKQVAVIAAPCMMRMEF